MNYSIILNKLVLPEEYYGEFTDIFFDNLKDEKIVKLRTYVEIRYPKPNKWFSVEKTMKRCFEIDAYEIAFEHIYSRPIESPNDILDEMLWKYMQYLRLSKIGSRSYHMWSAYYNVCKAMKAYWNRFKMF